ncbi:hypothetical protein ElyMa_003491200 [Elysia marginata]|uniref:SCP domain-containing protein n=1 Tax=Elysia marginata TaxID=1093978 RepID=A0AAV4ED67_9GAST|nr:hypothetical protein ElyMa_003491200 [Elysia marginata]
MEIDRKHLEETITMHNKAHKKMNPQRQRTRETDFFTLVGTPSFIPLAVAQWRHGISYVSLSGKASSSSSIVVVVVEVVVIVVGVVEAAAASVVVVVVVVVVEVEVVVVVVK